MKLMMLNFSFLFTLVALAATPRVQETGDAKSHYQVGIKAYQEQNFEAASKAFNEALSLEPDNKLVLYNLGLSAMKNSQPGLAVAAWRKSLYLDPSFGPAKRALELILDKIPGVQNSSINFWEEYRSKVLSGLSIHMAIGMVLIFLTTGVILLLRYFGFRRQALLYEKPMPKFPVIGVIFLLLLVFSLILSITKGIDYFQPRATIVVEQTSLKTGPGAEHSSLIELSQGNEVIVTQVNKGWAQVTYPGGLTGWLPMTDLFHTSGKELR